ncbi:L-ribulose-5-phosphate 4-epimerase [Hymenobacter edaphi]|uniref:L-ribulose-5-phosphate 4-epimerase n=3 Tax=Hymenobacter edaphi TaxID=2211146 RepID=A0A328BTD7_9BACT|nr:L-ribulose-5-phosphate 4-epimerase [Hymenobacter edaphi]RAK69286.1 L-ribulose-5-phosphate 4-epimerase [Hymenobacter edaphi]
MYQDLKQACYEANMQLPRLGLVLFTFGNASVVDRDNRVFAIKPSGVPYETLRPADIVVVDFANHIVEGSKRPSSDTKTHAVLYAHWEHLGGIVHTHSTYATAWAQAQLDIPLLGTTHADHLTVDVPCAPPMADPLIQGDYEHQTGWQILNEFQQRGLSPAEVEMVLIGNHAPFTWGTTVAKAVYNSAVLEEIARMAYLSCTLRPGVPRLKDALIRKHYERKHGAGSYYGQS